MRNKLTPPNKPKTARKGRLVIGRKHNESVRIGDDVTVTMVIVNGQTRLAIEAPVSTHIIRTELEKRNQ